MRKIYVLLISSFLLSCGDGDFDRPEFQFSDIDIQDCGAIVLFKTNEAEAFFLNLNENDIKNEANELLLTLSSSRSATYRIFDDKVTSAYFCNDIPPTSPNILKNWTGTGSVSIVSTEILDEEGLGTGNFSHQINLINLVLSSDQGTLSYDDYDFGVYETLAEPN